jgi:hypothetical protein
VQLRGGSRQDALQWLAHFCGTTLEDAPQTPENRARYQVEKKAAELDMPDALRFRRGVIQLTHETLEATKSRYFNPTETQSDYTDVIALQDLTRLLERLRGMGEGLMLAEYRSWRDQYPGLTYGIVRAVAALEVSEMRALRAYLRQTNPKRPVA